jgi:hypothetical protein
MISRFKFLTDNDEEEMELPIYDIEPNIASWMWARSNAAEIDPHWVPEEMLVTSIRTFLMNFPEQMIVPILSITGDNITMTMDNEHDAWPFNILGGTPLQIVYLRWSPE